MRARVLRTAFVAVSILALTASAVFALAGPDDGKMQYMEEVADSPPAWVEDFDAIPASGAECEDGMAAIFPCENIDLSSFVSLPELGGATGNDIWGWTDPKTDDEYAIMGTSDGTAFVDVTDPADPDVRGVMPSQSLEGLPLWRDIKVHDDHAFVVSEHSGHGMQVFDLRRLRVDELAGVEPPQQVYGPDAVYNGGEADGGDEDTTVSNTHNLFINTDSGFGYLVGTNTCDGGLHMVDVRDPMEPTFAGCYADDGYTHDVECQIYDGPDNRHKRDEICFASNEDSVTVVDVTDKADPVELSRTEYETASYTHQGGLTPDGNWFLFNDELDEMSGAVDNTTTYIQRMDDLSDPGDPVPYAHDSQTIDHNLYLDDDGFVRQSHYNEGLRIHEYSDELLSNGELNEVAFFDVVPAVDVNQFAGTWSNYRFDSGTVVVSAIESGLFVLDPDLPEPDRTNCPGKSKKCNEG